MPKPRSSMTIQLQRTWGTIIDGAVGLRMLSFVFCYCWFCTSICYIWWTGWCNFGCVARDPIVSHFFFSDVINVLYIALCHLHKLCYSQNCCWFLFLLQLMNTYGFAHLMRWWCSYVCLCDDSVRFERKYIWGFEIASPQASVFERFASRTVRVSGCLDCPSLGSKTGAIGA